MQYTRQTVVVFVELLQERPPPTQCLVDTRLAGPGTCLGSLLLGTESNFPVFEVGGLG